MVTAKSGIRDGMIENQPQRTLLLFGLSPARGTSNYRRPAGAYLQCDPDRLLLPMVSDVFVTSEELADRDSADAARNQN
jgi:hypothetical protein